MQKIYEIDPITCPKCQGRMKVISFIQDPEIIKKIFKHLNLWNLIDYSTSQLTVSDRWPYVDSEYPEAYPV